MKVLLTGGSGMVGMNVQMHPAAQGVELDAPSSSQLNLLDYKQTEAYIQENAPDVIVHAAGCVGGIQANIKEPVRFLVENMDMGRNIVMAARSVGVPALVNLGSSCMYPRNAENPLKESMILQGELEPTNEGYALAKIATARLCQYIRSESPQFLYKTLVPCNLYGHFDTFDPAHSHMVPAIIHKMHMAKTTQQDSVDIWGDGTVRREFMYAGDLADCIWKAVNDMDALPDVMNVGLGNDYSVNDYYQVAKEIVGYEGAFEHDLTKPVGMKQKLVDVTLAEQWGWKARTSLADGLANTYKYYLAEMAAEQ